MNQRVLKWLSLADVVLLPAFILWFIWRLQFTARWTWIFSIVWIAASFLLHRDTPKTVGWRADNLWVATKQALVFFGAMIAGLVITGIILGAPRHLPPNLASWRRLESYGAFCLLQQVILNSVFQNRMLTLIPKDWLAAVLSGAIFSACHWPNPVLLPLTFVGGTAMAYMFTRVRNIIPLTIGQAILGSIVWWAFPVAWHHHLRVGPGYYTSGR
jgi:hypothetical protein